LPGNAQAGLPTANAHHTVGQSPLADRQSDRSSDQSHPHNGNRIEVLHDLRLLSWQGVRFESIL
jgi:hypothetical protein